MPMELTTCTTKLSVDGIPQNRVYSYLHEAILSFIRNATLKGNWPSFLCYSRFENVGGLIN